MLRKITIFIPYLLTALSIIFGLSMPPAMATLEPNLIVIDSYVTRYLQARETITLKKDSQGNIQEFSPTNLSAGKILFEQHCLNCHIGGATLPDPTVPLSLKALQEATPPRDNIGSLVTFLREPMTYDGTDFTYWCRQVPETWMSQTEIENLAAFVLRAAQKAPDWGNTR